MYVILVYDIEKKRVGKACKFMRKHLTWVQNSVFEGEISAAKLKEIKMGLKKIMKEDADSVLIYRMRTAGALQHETMGVEKNPMNNLL